MSKKLSTALSEENIKEILHDNLEYFRNIESGSEESWRFKAYHSGRNDQHFQADWVTFSGKAARNNV